MRFVSDRQRRRVMALLKGKTEDAGHPRERRIRELEEARQFWARQAAYSANARHMLYLTEREIRDLKGKALGVLPLPAGEPEADRGDPLQERVRELVQQGYLYDHALRKAEAEQRFERLHGAPPGKARLSMRDAQARFRKEAQSPRRTFNVTVPADMNRSGSLEKGEVIKDRVEVKQDVATGANWTKEKIVIDQDVPRTERPGIIAHEAVEKRLSLNRGWPIAEAHQVANKVERQVCGPGEAGLRKFRRETARAWGIHRANTGKGLQTWTRR